MLTHVGTRPIKTERLLLRPFPPSDAASVLANWASDEAVQSLYAEPTYTTFEAVNGLLEKYIGGYERPDYYRWAVVEPSSGQCIGQIAYFLVDGKNHFGEIEYCIGRAFQNRGYATEVTRAVVAFGFEQMNLHKVQISVKEINPASRRVIEKCGFTYEGTLRDYFYESGRYVSRLYYSMLRSEFALLFPDSTAG